MTPTPTTNIPKFPQRCVGNKGFGGIWEDGSLPERPNLAPTLGDEKEKGKGDEPQLQHPARGKMGDDCKLGDKSLSQHPNVSSASGDDKEDEKGDERDKVVSQHPKRGSKLGDKSEIILAAVSDREMSQRGDEREKSIGRMLEMGQKGHIRMLKDVVTREMSQSGDEGNRSLGRMLEAVVKKEMSSCSLVIAFDYTFDSTFVLAPLLALPNPRQVSLG